MKIFSFSGHLIASLFIVSFIQARRDPEATCPERIPESCCEKFLMYFYEDKACLKHLTSYAYSLEGKAKWDLIDYITELRKQ